MTGKYLVLQVTEQGAQLLESSKVTPDQAIEIIDGVATWLGLHMHTCPHTCPETEGERIMSRPPTSPGSHWGPAPELPAGASPELVAMNEALWAWVDAGSFDVKVALMACMDDHDPEARTINRTIGDIARAWGEYLATLR